jgi:hypothetical protein
MEISLSPQVTLQLTEDGGILVDRSGEPYYELDDVGVRLWQLLAEDGDFDNAIDQLLLEYEVGSNSPRRNGQAIGRVAAQAAAILRCDTHKVAASLGHLPQQRAGALVAIQPRQAVTVI